MEPKVSPLKARKAEIFAPGVFWANLMHLILTLFEMKSEIL
jgi:hypothetical protein